MKDIITALNSLLRDNVVQALSKLCDAVKTTFEYLDNVRAEKQQKASDKEIAEAADSVSDACKNGELDDLLDSVDKLKKARKTKTIVAICALLLAGCTTIEIHATKQWEGRYSNVEAAAAALRDAKLDRKESVWLLSSRTLERILTKDKE